jgi:hypothetical protein
MSETTKLYEFLSSLKQPVMDQFVAIEIYFSNDLFELRLRDTVVHCWVPRAQMTTAQ